MRISVIGGGYVGLVSAACLAELGHYVKLIEIEYDKVCVINSEVPPIYERGLKNLLSKTIVTS